MLFSSAGTPGTSGAGQAGAASVTQVAAGAKTLYKSPGVLNTDRSSRLDAAPFAPFVGATSDKRAPQLTVIAASAGPIDVTTRSEKSGPAAETFVSGSFEGSVQDATVGGSSAQDSFAPATGSVGYSGSTTAPVSLNVDRMTGTGPVDASITTSSGHGFDQLSIAKGGTVNMAHNGPATTFTLTLSSEPHNGLPSSFTSGPISIGSGQTATISGLHWSSLSSGTISVKVGKHRVLLHNRAPLVRLVSVRQVAVHQLSHHQVQLVIAGKLASRAGAARVVVLWVVRSGKKLLARHDALLSPQQGAFRASWTVKLAPAKDLTLTTEVVAVSEKGANAASSTVTRTTTFSVS